MKMFGEKSINNIKFVENLVIYWKMMSNILTKDDLFVRVAVGMFGLSMVFFGFWIFSILSFFTQHYYGFLFVQFLGGFFISLGLLVMLGIFMPPTNRIYKVVKIFYPNNATMTVLELIPFYIFVMLLPAVILTFVLRYFGVVGYRSE